MNAGAVETVIGGTVGMAAMLAASMSKIEGEHGGPRDAYRHCIWACEMTKFIGAGRAWVILTNHEIFASSAQSDSSMIMDMNNNLAGIASAKDPSMSCGASCKQKLRQCRFARPGNRPFQQSELGKN